MAMSIGFEHQGYLCVYYENVNGFFNMKNTGVYIMKIEMGFHGSFNWF